MPVQVSFVTKSRTGVEQPVQIADVRNIRITRNNRVYIEQRTHPGRESQEYKLDQISDFKLEIVEKVPKG